MRRLPLAMAAAVVAVCGVASGAWAQAGAASEQGSAARKGVVRPLETVLQRMSKDLGHSILADASLSRAQAALPEVATSAENIEDQLDALVKQLPRGTVWAKVMLPPAQRGRAYRANDLLEYVLAQSRLFGTVGSSKAGTVEILGQKLDAQKAEPVVSTLSLKPYYLVANPSTHLAGPAADGTPAQIDQMVQGMRSILGLDPQQRSQAMQLMFRSFGELIQTLPPDQRREFFTNMMRGGANGANGDRVIFARPRP